MHYRRDQVADYSHLMSLSLPLVADEVLDSYRLDRHRCLLDVGGGEGVFGESAAARNPDLKVMVFDVPAVANRAKARLTGRGLDKRIDTIGGDFLADPLPKGADVISLVRVILDHDDANALRILQAVSMLRCRKTGYILLAEPLAETPGAEPVGTYFNMYLRGDGKRDGRETSTRLARS